MKKLLIVFIMLFTLTGCGHGSVKEITYKEYRQKMDNKESFILFIGSHNCGHCTDFKITLDRVIKKYNVTFNYIDTASLTEEEYNSLNEDIKYDSTPTTVFIKKGLDDSCNVFTCDSNKRIEGALSYEKVIEVLKNQKYIKG